MELRKIADSHLSAENNNIIEVEPQSFEEAYHHTRQRKK